MPVGIGKQEEKEQESIETSQEAVTGHQKSDIPDPIDRTKALELFNDYLSVLEDHQSELLRRESFRDDELNDSEQETGEHYKASVYAASVVYISELKALVENVEKL